jgi:hypothetical protein
MQEQLNNGNRDGTSKRGSKVNAKIKTTITEMKNACDELISRLDMAKKRIREVEYTSTETLQTVIQKEKEIIKKKIVQNSQEPWNSFKRYNSELLEYKNKRRKHSRNI